MHATIQWPPASHCYAMHTTPISLPRHVQSLAKYLLNWQPGLQGLPSDPPDKTLCSSTTSQLLSMDNQRVVRHVYPWVHGRSHPCHPPCISKHIPSANDNSAAPRTQDTCWACPHGPLYKTNIARAKHDDGCRLLSHEIQCSNHIDGAMLHGTIADRGGLHR